MMKWVPWCLATLGLLLVPAVEAQQRGFALQRYEPTGAGQRSFWIDHPWYDEGHDHLALALTLDNARHPLVLGTASGSSVSVISNQLVGHLGIAGSLFNRLLLTGGLPVVLQE